MKTAVVILNWNTEEFLARWIPGLLESCSGRDARVIVADNGSTDGSVALIRSRFPEVQLMELGTNYGFTGGYNRALASIDAEYFVLINSDIEVSGNWLSPLTEWMDSHPECGVCGPKLKQMNDRNRFEYAGAAGGYLDFFGYPYCRGRVLGRTETDHGQYDEPAEVTWVSGACLMVRSSVWRELGGLDERFFAHMEEIDLCWRALSAGWKVTVVPSSEVWHLGGGTLPQGSPHKLFLNYRNNLLMMDKNLPAGFRYRIGIRYCLDIINAFAYICTLKFPSFKAVFNAHRAYREMRKGPYKGATNRLSGTLLAIEFLKKR